MTTTYTTRSGDTVDSVCHQFYGRTSGTVEAVLEANTGLAELGEILPLGVSIVLPEVEQPEEQRETLF